MTHHTIFAVNMKDLILNGCTTPLKLYHNKWQNFTPFPRNSWIAKLKNILDFLPTPHKGGASPLKGGAWPPPNLALSPGFKSCNYSVAKLKMSLIFCLNWWIYKAHTFFTGNIFSFDFPWDNVSCHKKLVPYWFSCFDFQIIIKDKWRRFTGLD